MQRSQQMLLNAMCLTAAPEILRFSALFADMAEAMNSAMSGFAAAFDEDAGKKNHAPLSEFFHDELDGFAEEVLDLMQNQGASIEQEYAELLVALENEGSVQQAQTYIAQIAERAPQLTALDGTLSSKDILAYVGILGAENAVAVAVQGFIDCFTPILNKMHEDAQQQHLAEQQREQNFFAAACNGETDKLMEFIEQHEFDMEAENSERFSPLALAVKHEKLHTVQALLEKGAIPVKFFPHESPLKIAVENNLPEMLGAILQSAHASLDDVDYDDLIYYLLKDEFYAVVTAVIEHARPDIQRLAKRALENGAVKLLSYFLEHGVPTDGESYDDSLALHAIKQEQPAVLQMLAERGANMNALDFFDESLLCVAIKENDTPAINLLLKHGAKIQCREHYEEKAYLDKLAEILAQPIAKLIEKGCIDCLRFDSRGQNFLHYAVNHDDVALCIAILDTTDIDIDQLVERGDDVALTLVESKEVLQLLLDRGVYVNTRIEGKSILVHCRHRDDWLIEALLEAGADANGAFADEPLLHTALRDERACVTALLYHDVDVHTLDKHDRGIVQKHIAYPHRMLPYMDVFIKRKLSFNVKCLSGAQAAHVLAALYPADIIERLCRMGLCDFSVENESGTSALLQACYAGNHDNVRALLELGMDVNTANSLGVSALCYAAYNGDEALCNILLEHAADKTLTIGAITPYQIAKLSGHTQLLALLE